MAYAKAMGWHSVRIKGTKEFKEKVFKEAYRNDIEIANYNRSIEDKNWCNEYDNDQKRFKMTI